MLKQYKTSVQILTWENKNSQSKKNKKQTKHNWTCDCCLKKSIGMVPLW